MVCRDLGLVSVWQSEINLSNSWGYPKVGRSARVGFHHLCAGSPITFTRYEPERLIQTDLVIDHFVLPELRQAAAVAMDGLASQAVN